MHVSTISRAIKGKYIYTSFGTIAIEKLFSATSTQTDSQGKISQQQILKKIEELIMNEDKQKPLSDQKIANILQNDGYHLARRTITKYRESMDYPSSTKRKLK